MSIEALDGDLDLTRMRWMFKREFRKDAASQHLWEALFIDPCLVTLTETTATCTCPDFELRHQRRKHIYAVEYTLSRQEQPDGSTIVTRTTRVTYRQDWPVYNAAQTHERSHFLELLRSLCDGIMQPPQSRGRPRHLLADVVFSLVCKVYAMRSGRRSMSDLLR